MRDRIKSQLEKMVAPLLDAPGISLTLIFLIASVAGLLLPSLFFQNSIGVISGIGFTMLGFGITATSVLSSVISAPTVILMRSKEPWKQLTQTFTRSNIVFLCLGLFGLLTYKELLTQTSIFSSILKMLYAGILALTASSAISIIIILHKILSAPLTDEQLQSAITTEGPHFTAPPPSKLVKQDDIEAVVIDSSD